MKSRLMALLAVAFALASYGDQANAIVRLLNSRASGSPRGYAEAAEDCRTQTEGFFVAGDAIDVIRETERRKFIDEELPIFRSRAALLGINLKEFID